MSENTAIFSGEGSGVSPPWEVLTVVTDYMDGKTLATSSCVSKTWSLCFAETEHQWRSLLTTHYPSLSAVTTPSPSISFRRLYSVAESSANRRRLVKQPKKPKISLSDLTFIVHVRNSDMNMRMVKQGKGITIPSNGLFRFNIDVKDLEGSTVSEGDLKDAKVTWNVVFREWESVFTMADSVRSLQKQKWFYEELPAPEYCLFSRGSGLAADVELEMTGENRVVNVEKLWLGIMNTVDLTSLELDDGLRYLERFLI